MLVDHPMTLRKKILKSFSMPEDEDIIIYNQSFATLIDKDVQSLYDKYYSQYKEKNDKYIEINKKLDNYDDFLRNAKLVNEHMSEQDYIRTIQELEKEYAKKYAEIKGLEKKVEIYKNRISQQNQKIANKIQEQEVLIQKQKANKIQELNKVNIQIGQYETYVQFFNEYAKEFKFLMKMLGKEEKHFKDLYELAINDNTRCDKCRRRMYPKPVEIENIINQILQRIQSHKDSFEVSQIKQKEYKRLLKVAKSRALELADEIKLSNATYIKKSPEILQLEGVKFSLFEELEKAQVQIEEAIKKQDKEYNVLKGKINAYRESLNNLITIKRISQEIGNLKELQAEYADQLDTLKPKLALVTQFIDVKHKVFEDRLNGMFDNRIKFQFYELQDYEFKEVCEMKFDNIDFGLLTQEQAKEMNELIVSRFRYID